ncbi:unnamed protein product [Nesidiocoris tenuis]|uniref:Uncharacterized protein n=1 Tax=Nesidiocoris tenuis TaxID=355587 RepID=A0A6H5GFH3_9HEMI|nr:unnamed protein product [Nesidiocoris tenuis]
MNIIKYYLHSYNVYRNKVNSKIAIERTFFSIRRFLFELRSSATGYLLSGAVCGRTPELTASSRPQDHDRLQDVHLSRRRRLAGGG